jgi:hypothetical protein
VERRFRSLLSTRANGKPRPPAPARPFSSAGRWILGLLWPAEVRLSRASGALIVGQYGVTVGVTLLDTPLFYAVTGLLDRRDEPEEVIERL